MVLGREEIRDELHAILAAREELGPEHQQHLVEGFLDRLEGGGFGPPPAQSARRGRGALWVLLAAAVIAAGGGTAALQHVGHYGVVQARPLPDIIRLDAQVPAFVRRLPLTHYTSRRASSLLGQVIVDDYGGPYPYAFVNFYLRYQNCPVTPRGAFHLTIETVGYQVTSHTRDGRLVIARTGPLTRWSRPAVFWDRTLTASLMFPTPHPGLYFWKVEVPSDQGCAWQIYYYGS